MVGLVAKHTVKIYRWSVYSGFALNNLGLEPPNLPEDVKYLIKWAFPILFSSVDMGLLFLGRSMSIQVSVQHTDAADAAGPFTFFRILKQSVAVVALHFPLLFSQLETETNARAAMESTSRIAWRLNSVSTLSSSSTPPPPPSPWWSRWRALINKILWLWFWNMLLRIRSRIFGLWCVVGQFGIACNFFYKWIWYESGFGYRVGFFADIGEGVSEE